MKSLQAIRSSRDRQVLQRIKPPPHALVKQIELANLIPPVAELRDYGEVCDELYGILEAGVRPVGQSEFGVYRLKFFRTMVGFLHGNMPPQKFPTLYEYLGPIEIDRSIQLFDRFRNIYGARALLEAIASAQIKGRIAPGKQIEMPPEATHASVALSIDNNYRLKIETGLLLDALIGVDAGRIRRCSECARIFWAGRIDKHACSDKCVNRRNVRLWRERYAQQYKLQRAKKAEAAESTEDKSNQTMRRKSQ